MRRPIVAANWKMYKTVHEAIVYIKELRKIAKDGHDVEIVVAPPFTAIHPAMEAARASNIAVAAQDVYFEKEGAFTSGVTEFFFQIACVRNLRRDLNSGRDCAVR